jgi:hypothetical protein
MVVPVALVSSVAMPVVEVVDVVVVGEGDVPATRTVSVIMILVERVTLWLALVVVPVVLSVQMSVVDIVDMITMGDGHVAAALAMDVRMVSVFAVRGCHR